MEESRAKDKASSALSRRLQEAPQENDIRDVDTVIDGSTTAQTEEMENEKTERSEGLDTSAHIEESDEELEINPKVNREKKICAIGGGKGGVGKTVITASMGIELANLGKKVVLVDGDLGGANLHAVLGILSPKYTYHDFYTKKVDSLEAIVLDTPVENLKFISGAAGVLGLANPRFYQKLRFITSLRNIDADYILLDLGAGSTYNIIDFFIAADRRIVVTTPDLPAFHETFNFLKIAVFRILQRHFRQNVEILSILYRNTSASFDHTDVNVFDLVEKIETADINAGVEAMRLISGFKPELILNMIHNTKELKKGLSLRVSVKEHLAVDLDFLGAVEFDEIVRNAVNNARPFAIHSPKSKASKQVATIVPKGILGKTRFESMKDRRTEIKKNSEYARKYPHMPKNEIICSVNCYFWGECRYQKGGFPCPLKELKTS